MKAIIALTFALLAVASGSAIVQELDVPAPAAGPATNLGGALKSFYAAAKKMMPCGYAPYKIPPLAPFTVESLPFDIDFPELKLNGSFSNLFINGLDSYQILKMNFDEKTNTVSADINLEELQVLGEYEMNFWAMVAGFPVSFAGEGVIDYKINEIRSLARVEFKPTATGLEISEFKTHFYIGEVLANNWNKYWDISINNFVNHLVPQYIEMWAQHVQEDINEMIKKYYIPHINELLANTTMEDVTKMYLELAKTFDEVEC